MIEDAIIEHIVIPAAIQDAGAFILVGTLTAVMFISYHLTNGVERRLKERRR